MYLSEALQEETTRDHAGDIGHCLLYSTAMHERHSVVQLKSGRLYWETLWDSLAPKGNIYRYIGLSTERLRNSADLWRQLDKLAEDYKHLFVGDTHEARTAELCRALESVQVKGAPDPENGKDATATCEGFQPLQEFLSDSRASFCGPFVMPTGADALKTWSSFRFMALMVCAIQWIAPLLIFINQWEQPQNKLQDIAKFTRSLTVTEVFCLGNNTKDRLHTLMGVMLLSLIILIIHFYIREQRNNSRKSSRLPMCRFWYVLGNITNMWCCFWTALAVPVLFWGESTPTTTAMDSLTILFLFMLDDFAGYASTYTGMSDGQFQRAAAWQLALLSQCPVLLKEVINPAAKHVDDFWQIGFDADGRLQAGSPEAADGRLKPSVQTSSAALGLCARRIERVTHEETAPLLTGSHVLLYRASASDCGQQLPRWEASVLAMAWGFMDVLFTVLQFVLPIVWMAVDKPCGRGKVAIS